MQMVPGMMPEGIYGIAGAAHMPVEEYCARVLERVIEGVLDHLDLGGGLLVNYSELPQAVETRILPHFGIEPSPAGRAAMAAAGHRDAKTPALSFTGDSDAKQAAASAAVRAAAGRLDAPYAALEALRRAHSADHRVGVDFEND